MLILTIRTDKPEAEVGLYKNDERLVYKTWQAHRQLSETLHLKIEELLNGDGYVWSDITGVTCYKGPGSFTGLRIGVSVANALASSLDVPVVSESGDSWTEVSLERLKNNEDEEIVSPDYGREARITLPKK